MGTKQKQRKRKRKPGFNLPCEQPWHRHHGACQRDPRTGRCSWCNLGNKTGIKK